MRSHPPITFYWRPGCGFCSSLRRALEGTGLDILEVDIWEEPEAAAVVRRFARGNETVPTVVIGAVESDAAIGLVNPAPVEVLRAVADHAPGSQDRG